MGISTTPLPRPPRAPPPTPHVNSVVSLCRKGGPSHVDPFDPKPALAKFDGTAYKGHTPIGSNNRPIGNLMKSPFPFKKHGDSGLPISSLFPHTAKHA